MQTLPPLDVTEFRHLVDALCADVAADLAATHHRLERLRLLGPDAGDDEPR
jgi:uncharacterized protein YecA (UPF0149 family)